MRAGAPSAGKGEIRGRRAVAAGARMRDGEARCVRIVPKPFGAR